MVSSVAMESFNDTVDFMIMLISLAENLFTTYYFNEDKFGVITIALIFCFEPILDSCVKQLMNCTECDWDNFLYDLISEGVQCALYIHFCDYTDLAKLALPLMMAGQVFLMTLLKVKEECCDKIQQDTAEEKATKQCMNLCAWFYGNCMTLLTSLLPLIYLAYQEEAPYRQKPFEMILTFNYWIADLAMEYNMKSMEEAMLKHKQPQRSRSQRVLQVIQAAFQVYTYVLAWIYWFSPEIEQTFDKVFTMATMVISVCAVPITLLQVLCCNKGLDLDPDENNDPDPDPDENNVPDPDPDENNGPDPDPTPIGATL